MILYCHCANTAIVSDDVRTRAIGELLRRGDTLLATADLCELAAVHPAWLRGMLPAGSAVAACHTRGTKWILEFAGVSTEGLQFIDLRSPGSPFEKWHGHLAHVSQGRPAPANSQGIAADHGRDARGTHGRDGHATESGLPQHASSAESPAGPMPRLAIWLGVRPEAAVVVRVLAGGWSLLFLPTIDSLPGWPVPILGDFAGGRPDGLEAGGTIVDVSAMGPEQIVEALAASLPAAPPGPAWLPWFPVIDYSRCTSCGQCHNFCLFGVYGKRDGRVVVDRPARCKPNCPACGRVCPACAIVFPKYTQAPINGEEVRPEHLLKQKTPAQMRGEPPADMLADLRKRQEEQQRAIAQQRKDPKEKS